MKMLHQPLQLGDLALNNWVAMVPITRSRSGADGIPAEAGMVAFCRQYVSNPDLVACSAAGGPYAERDRFSFYGGTASDYADYPTFG